LSARDLAPVRRLTGGIQFPALNADDMDTTFTITKLSGIEGRAVITSGSLSPSGNGLNFVAPAGVTKSQGAKRPDLRLVQD
jgi:hypothetical protein